MSDVDAAAYAAKMAAKYGPITTWAALMSAARSEGWPMSLADLRLRAYQAASPQQRLEAVRRSVRLAIEAHVVRWPVVSHPSWSATTSITTLRQRLTDWALADPGSDVDVEIDAIYSVRRDVAHACGGVHAHYIVAKRNGDPVDVDDTAAADALNTIAEAAAGSVWADAPLVEYLAEHGALEERPARGSDGEAARRAAATGARCAAEAAGLVAIIAIDTETKAAADWASIEYICGVLDGVAARMAAWEAS